MHKVSGLSIDNWRAGDGIIWKCPCSFVWQLMLVVSWGCWLGDLHLASPCSLIFLIAREPQDCQKWVSYLTGRKLHWLLWKALHVIQHYFQSILFVTGEIQVCSILRERVHRPLPLGERGSNNWWIYFKTATIYPYKKHSGFLPRSSKSDMCHVIRLRLEVQYLIIKFKSMCR